MQNKKLNIDIQILKELSHVSITSMEDRIKNDVFHFDIMSGTSNERGTGCDRVKEIAFKKAQSELIERLVLRIAKKHDESIDSSNGFAAHSTLEKAQRSAKNELIERDLFLTSWFSGRNPFWETDKIHAINHSLVVSEAKLFEDVNLELKIGYIGNCSNVHCIMAITYDKSGEFGGIFSAGADQDINLALEKAILEQRRIATYIINSINTGTPVYTPKLDLVKTTDHQNIYLNKDKSSFIKKYISTSNNPITLSPVTTSFIEYALPEPIGRNTKVVQCVSNDVQKYFIGNELSQINYKRIMEVGELDLSRRTHPFG